MSLSTILISDDVRLDLGHTLQTGALSLKGEDIILTSETGTASILARHVFVGIDGLTISARPNAVLVEEFGLAQKLPAALVASGHFAEVERHSAVSAWGVDVVELELTDSALTESE